MTYKSFQLIQSTGELVSKEVPFYIQTSISSILAVSAEIALPINSATVLESIVRLELFESSISPPVFELHFKNYECEISINA